MPRGCALCGLLCADGEPNVGLDALRDTVKLHCLPTPLVYRTVMCSTQTSAWLCPPCNDWFSRTSKSRPTRKQHIPMDSMLLYLKEPHPARVPDTRNVRRLLHALTHTVAGFRNANTHDTTIADVLALVRESRHKTDIARISDAWWRLNGNCEIFANAGLSSCVRRLQRHAPY